MTKNKKISRFIIAPLITLCLITMLFLFSACDDGYKNNGDLKVVRDYVYTNEYDNRITLFTFETYYDDHTEYCIYYVMDEHFYKVKLHRTVWLTLQNDLVNKTATSYIPKTVYIFTIGDIPANTSFSLSGKYHSFLTTNGYIKAEQTTTNPRYYAIGYYLTDSQGTKKEVCLEITKYDYDKLAEKLTTQDEIEFRTYTWSAA